MENALRPASANEFAQIMYRMQGHFWHPNMPQNLMTEVAKDYKRLLADVGGGVLLETCDEILLTPGLKNFPKIGDFHALLTKKTEEKKTRLERVSKLIELAE